MCQLTMHKHTGATQPRQPGVHVCCSTRLAQVKAQPHPCSIACKVRLEYLMAGLSHPIRLSMGFMGGHKTMEHMHWAWPKGALGL
jgi:hypothetical protein